MIYFQCGTVELHFKWEVTLIGSTHVKLCSKEKAQVSKNVLF